MTEKEEWINWINDQLKDMYNDKDYVDTGNNRIFKTTDDDREVALYLLNTMKTLFERKNN